MLMVTFESGFSAEGFLNGAPGSQIGSSVQVEDGTFNLQIQAIEVTQGVRGDIPIRTSPQGDLVLLSDGAVHVADRRTVVRAYPWVENHSAANLPPMIARLWAYRDGVLLPGSPIEPQNPLLSHISEDWDLATMRADAGKSWNFVLPSAWTASDPEFKSFSLRFIVEVNPPGPGHQPECQGCNVDNQVTLVGQEFVTVPTLVIQPYFVQHTLTDLKNEQVTYLGPSQQAFEALMRSVQGMLPVGDLGHGLIILPPTNVEWQGPLYKNGRHVFPEAMIKEYLPGGKLKERQDNVVHIFVFKDASNHDFLAYNNSGGVWLNLAWTGKPYVQCAARGWDLVHELTHAIGLSHAGSMNGETTTNSAYPDPHGRVEKNAFGFDIWEMRAIPPTSENGETHDYMSYNKTNPTWVSIYTWETIGELLGQPALDV
jgi:hypothetical protein